MGEGHENAKCRLISQALYGLSNIQVQTVNCFEQAVAAVSVLVPSILKMGLRHKGCVAHCGPVVAVTWNTLPFFLLHPPELLLWLLELSEGVESRIAVESLDCNVGALAGHMSETAHGWLNHTFTMKLSDWLGLMWADFLGTCWSRWADLFVYPLVCVLLPLRFLLWAGLVLRIVSRSWAVTSNHLFWRVLQTAESTLYLFVYFILFYLF